jgi:hypothetical protein
MGAKRQDLEVMNCVYCGASPRDPHRDAPYWAHSEAGDADPCPGDCNRAWVAAERAAFNERAAARAKNRQPRPDLVNHDVPMVPDAPMWCRPCQEHIITTSESPTLCATLTPGPLNTGRDVDTGPRPVAVNPPSPSPAWDQADEIIRWAINAEDQLRAHVGDIGRGPRPWRTLSATVYYLTAHPTALLSCPDAVAIGFEALAKARRLEQVTGSDRLIHRLPGTCMVCDRKRLQRSDGDDLVKRRFCGACWDWEYYQFLAKTYADGVRAG